jgi:hypothetical protein
MAATGLLYAVTPRFAPTSSDTTARIRRDACWTNMQGVYLPNACRGKPRGGRMGSPIVPLESQLSRRLRPLSFAAGARRLRTLHPPWTTTIARAWGKPVPAIAFCVRHRICSSAADCSTRQRSAPPSGAHSRSGTDVGGRDDLPRCCETQAEHTKSCNLPAAEMVAAFALLSRYACGARRLITS